MISTQCRSLSRAYRPAISSLSFACLRRSFSTSYRRQAVERPSTIAHVIFDYDGVLIDSEKIFTHVNAHCLQVYGREYNMQLKQGQMGRRLGEGVEWLLNATGLQGKVSVSEYVELWKRTLRESANDFHLMEGAERLVSHLHAANIPMAICTGSDREEFEMKTVNCKHLISMMDTLVLTGDDSEVKRGKPAPDPYLVTMGRMNLQPESAKRVLVIEDAVNGAKSGIAAGATTILIPQMEFVGPDWDTAFKELVEMGLCGVAASLEDIELEAFGLPPIKK